jgi:hypothetical protein
LPIEPPSAEIAPEALDQLRAFLTEDDVQRVAELMSLALDARECLGDIVSVAEPLGMEIPALNPAPPGMAEACDAAWQTIRDLLNAYVSPL